MGSGGVEVPCMTCTTELVAAGAPPTLLLNGAHKATVRVMVAVGLRRLLPLLSGVLEEVAWGKFGGLDGDSSRLFRYPLD